MHGITVACQTAMERSAQPASPSRRIKPVSDEGSHPMLTYAAMASVTYFVVVVFDREDGELRPGEPQEVRSAEAARRRVVSLAGAHAGVVAFSRSGDPATGEFSDAEILSQAGDVDLDALSA